MRKGRESCGVSLPESSEASSLSSRQPRLRRILCECARGGPGGKAKIRPLVGPVGKVGDGAWVTVAEVEGEGGHGDECLSEPELSEAGVIHERGDR